MKKLHHCATYGCHNLTDLESDYCPRCLRLMIESKAEEPGLAKAVAYVMSTLPTCAPPVSMHALAQRNVQARHLGLKSYGELDAREWRV